MTISFVKRLVALDISGAMGNLFDHSRKDLLIRIGISIDSPKRSYRNNRVREADCTEDCIQKRLLQF
ncbi:hypothetical protein C438_14701 [Haloferax denitrificans ATCC 35960]|uniref:Uncharacterized protein n=1 Tax=Haloferax denitrificans ATCC 35960 TaxID=662478 RepID=M0J1M3_9EURY|nr:hypothetical protein C438_14701 [Haloferax denitrificans ATCC 35960]